MTGPRPQQGQLDISKTITDTLVTHQNVKQELVITTVDKLKLCLYEHRAHLRARREWLGPASLLVALLTTLVAAEFRDALGLPAATWQAIYIIAAAAAVAATVVLVFRAISSIIHGGVDKLIDKIADRSQTSSFHQGLPAEFADEIRRIFSEPLPKNAIRQQDRPKK